MAPTVAKLVKFLPAPKVRASLVRAVVAYAETLGVEPIAFLAEVGLAPGDVADIDQEVSGLATVGLWVSLSKRFPNVAIGVKAAQMAPLSAFGALGYAARHAPTFGDSLALYLRYMSLLSSHVRMSILPEAAGQRLRLDHHARIAATRHPIEFGMTVALRVTGFPLPCAGLEEITFRHAPTGPLADYVDAFGIVPVFEASQNSMLFGPDLLARKLPEADGDYHAYLRNLLAHRPAFSPTEEDGIDAALQACVDHCDYRVEALAEKAGMTPRTLHRHLQKIGRTPRQIVDEARFQNARKLLAERTLAIADIAFMLGFSDERAFVRAFRRWSGRTPAAFRHLG